MASFKFIAVGDRIINLDYLVIAQKIGDNQVMLELKMASATAPGELIRQITFSGAQATNVWDFLNSQSVVLGTSPATSKPATLKEAREAAEKEVVQSALRRHQGKITSAAAELGISRPTL